MMLQAACNVFDEISPNDLRVLLHLRLAELPCHTEKMDIGISDGKLKSIVSDMKKKGIVQQRVMLGAISLTPKGNSLLDNLLIKIQ